MLFAADEPTVFATLVRFHVTAPFGSRQTPPDAGTRRDVTFGLRLRDGGRNRIASRRRPRRTLSGSFRTLSLAFPLGDGGGLRRLADPFPPFTELCLESPLRVNLCRRLSLSIFIFSMSPCSSNMCASSTSSNASSKLTAVSEKLKRCEMIAITSTSDLSGKNAEIQMKSASNNDAAGGTCTPFKLPY